MMDWTKTSRSSAYAVNTIAQQVVSLIFSFTVKIP